MREKDKGTCTVHLPEAYKAENSSTYLDTSSRPSGTLKVHNLLIVEICCFREAIMYFYCGWIRSFYTIV